MMIARDQYTPGPARGAEVRKNGEKWTLILVRDLRHSPDIVWQALTDPAQLREWAPFDADGSLSVPGATVKLTTVGEPTRRSCSSTTGVDSICAGSWRPLAAARASRCGRTSIAASSRWALPGGTSASTYWIGSSTVSPLDVSSALT